MSELVRRLSEGQHPVVISLGQAPSVQGLKEAIDRGYVHVRFTGTRGGTELGVTVDAERSDFSGANFEEEAGRLTVVGALTLDYTNVRCIADIQLPGLEGLGRLEPLAD